MVWLRAESDGSARKSVEQGAEEERKVNSTISSLKSCPISYSSFLCPPPPHAAVESSGRKRGVGTYFVAMAETWGWLQRNRPDWALKKRGGRG